jgi:hypothetical protein
VSGFEARIVRILVCPKCDEVTAGWIIYHVFYFIYYVRYIMYYILYVYIS